MRGGQAASQLALAHEKRLCSAWPTDWAQPGQHHRTRGRVRVATVACVGVTAFRSEEEGPQTKNVREPHQVLELEGRDL